MAGNPQRIWTKLRRVLFLRVIPLRKPRSLLARMLIDILTFGVVLYLAICLFAVIFADRMIFPVPTPSYEDGKHILKLPLRDGTEIAALYLPNPEAEYTLFYSHGNAEDLGHILPRLKQFHGRGFAVMAYDYPGYGISEGRPNENSLYQAAAAAFTYLMVFAEVDPDKVILYGRSLGSGPSVELASKKVVAGLILDGAFTSTFRVMTRWQILPWDKFDNLAKLPEVHCPTLIIHGEQDKTVPFRHALDNAKALVEEPQTLHHPQAGHNNLIELAGPDYWDAIIRFRDSLSQEKTDPEP